MADFSGMADLFTSIPEVRREEPVDLARGEFERACAAYIGSRSAHFMPWEWQGNHYANTGASYPGDNECFDEADMILAVLMAGKGKYPETLTELWVRGGQKHPDDVQMWYDGMQVLDRQGRWWLLVGPERVFRCRVRRGGGVWQSK